MSTLATSQFWGSGWSFPPTFEVGNYQLEMTHEVTNINQSIDVILQTHIGDRSVLPEYGSGLRQYTFRHMDATLQGELTVTVKSALLAYEPRISVTEVHVELADTHTGLLMISVAYAINHTNTRHNHVFSFYSIEGINLQP